MDNFDQQVAYALGLATVQTNNNLNNNSFYHHQAQRRSLPLPSLASRKRPASNKRSNDNNNIRNIDYSNNSNELMYNRFNYTNNDNNDHEENNDYDDDDDDDDDSAVRGKQQQKQKKKFKIYHNSNVVIDDPHDIPPFNDMLFQLLQFRSENGHCSVPHGDDTLFAWTVHIREQYRKKVDKDDDRKNSLPLQAEANHAFDPNILTKERMDVLNNIGFAWRKVRMDHLKNWYDSYDALVEFKEKHGHCNPTRSESTSLNSWVKKQRYERAQYEKEKTEQQNLQQKKEIKYVPLSIEEKIIKLDKLGIDWTVLEKPAGWDVRYQQLVEYKEQNGHCNVPNTYPPNPQLASWVANQRLEYTNKLLGLKNTIAGKREELLDKIGFRWVAPGHRKLKIADYKADDEKENEKEKQDDDKKEDDKEEEIQQETDTDKKKKKRKKKQQQQQQQQKKRQKKEKSSESDTNNKNDNNNNIDTQQDESNNNNNNDEENDKQDDNNNNNSADKQVQKE